MAGSWGTVLTGLVPLGLVISLSPLTVIPAVLVLQAPRPRPSSLAFLGGWLLSLAALTALAVARPPGCSAAWTRRRRGGRRGCAWCWARR